MLLAVTMRLQAEAFRLESAEEKSKVNTFYKQYASILDGDKYHLCIPLLLPPGPCSLANLWSTQLYKEICRPRKEISTPTFQLCAVADTFKHLWLVLVGKKCDTNKETL